MKKKFCIFLRSQEDEKKKKKRKEERNETDGNDKKLIGQQTIDTSSIKYKIY